MKKVFSIVVLAALAFGVLIGLNYFKDQQCCIDDWD